MKLSLDKVPLEIACPNCGKKIKKTVGWFKRDRDCPFGCGLRLRTNQFRRDILKAERELEKLTKSFK